MARYPDRSGGLTYDRTLRIMVERERARFGAWYEMFPRSCAAGARPARDAPGHRGAAALCRRDGVRRPLPAADPPDRPELPQRAEQHPDRRPRRPRQPLGHRRGRGRTQVDPPRARHPRRLRPPGRRGAGARHRDRPGHRLPVLARPPLRPRASRVVPPPARRHHQVRREPAQEVPGHLSDRLRVRRLEGPLGRAHETSSSSGSATASRSSASTTRTPSRSGSGTG